FVSITSSNSSSHPSSFVYANSFALNPKMPIVLPCVNFNSCSNWSRVCLLEIMMLDVVIPARLKDFDGAVQVINLSCRFSFTFASTVCSYPGITKSYQISSEITYKSCLMAISATFSNSSSVQTRPTGLCGLQNSKT